MKKITAQHKVDIGYYGNSLFGTVFGSETCEELWTPDSPHIEAAYLNQTKNAKSAGIFGSPSFIVEGELFWGDDRLEDAIAWSSKEALG